MEWEFELSATKGSLLFFGIFSRTVFHFAEKYGEMVSNGVEWVDKISLISHINVFLMLNYSCFVIRNHPFNQNEIVTDCEFCGWSYLELSGAIWSYLERLS